MNYEELMTDTDRMLKEMMRRNQIANNVICAAAVVVTAVLIVLLVMELKDRKKKAKRVFPSESGYRPTVMPDVQVVNGVEFHRMGPVGR